MTQHIATQIDAFLADTLEEGLSADERVFLADTLSQVMWSRLGVGMACNRLGQFYLVPVEEIEAEVHGRQHYA